MRNEWNEPSLLLRLLLLLSLIFQETLFVLFFLLWLKGFHTFPLSEGFQLLVKGHEIYLLALPHATLLLLKVWDELLPLLSTSWTFHCSCLSHSQVYGIVGVGALVPEQRGLCCSCPSWPDGTPGAGAMMADHCSERFSIWGGWATGRGAPQFTWGHEEGPVQYSEIYRKLPNGVGSLQFQNCRFLQIWDLGRWSIKFGNFPKKNRGIW